MVTVNSVKFTYKIFASNTGEPSRSTFDAQSLLFGLRSRRYLTVILRGRAGYELIYITNEAVGRVGYYQLISGKSEKNNCFSKFSSNPRFFRVKPPQIVTFSLQKTPQKKFFRPPKFQHEKFAISFSLFGQT